MKHLLMCSGAVNGLCDPNQCKLFLNVNMQNMKVRVEQVSVPSMLTEQKSPNTLMRNK